MALFETTERDLWRRQRETLEDLAAFVDAHAPGTAVPLPMLHWRVTTVGTIAAELYRHEPDPSGIRADPSAVVVAYAAALGVKMTERHSDITRKTHYVARGRIGRPIGAGRRPRTEIVITADVRDADDDSE